MVLRMMILFSAEAVDAYYDTYFIIYATRLRIYFSLYIYKFASKV